MRISSLFVLISISALADSKLPPSATHKIDFEKEVQPILAQKCHACHGDEAQQSGLRLDKRQNAMRGGDYGPVIMAGNSAGSIRPEMKLTLRPSLSSLAMIKVARWSRHAARAWAITGLSLHLPDSTSTNSPSNSVCR